MGRTEPTIVKPPPAFRRDNRAKRARNTINKVIPAILVAHPRAQRGIARSELIIDPAPFVPRDQQQQQVGGGNGDEDENDGKEGHGKKGGRRKHGGEDRRKGGNHRHDDDDEGKKARGQKSPHEEQVVSEDVEIPAPRIKLVVADTLAAAHALVESSSGSKRLHNGNGKDHAETNSHDGKKVKVGILNMASPLEPGGGFLNGATSQEEALCMRTTLLPGLRDEFYRLPELGVVYTPDVLVFRSLDNGDANADSERDLLPKNDRWFVDVVSAAMLRLPETDDGRYAHAAYREIVVKKMRAVLRVFAAKGCSKVVLGAWGCGAYGNPVVEIAEAWRKVLGPVDAPGSSDKGKKKNRKVEQWGAVIEDVVFAIKDEGLASAFSHAFGEEVLPISAPEVEERGSSSSTVGEEDDEEAIEAARINEVREKIKQLELQIGQARSPHFKAGLESVLAGLKKQVPANDGQEDQNHEECQEDSSHSEGVNTPEDSDSDDDEYTSDVDEVHGSGTGNNVV